MNKLKSLIFYLKVKKLTIAAVESVSGGYLSYLLTKIPGSSKVFQGGFVAYSLQSKNKLLRIPNQLLNKTQGVSENVSILLAKRTKQLFKTDLAVSLVGFASAPAQKGVKVGTVFMAVADRYGVISKKILIKGSRDCVRKQASLMAIDLLCKRLNSKH
jgi:nicotinamide-nucleotide amidase